MVDLSKEQIQSVKKSYLNILALFLGQEKIESRFLRCLLKWGFQLQLNPDDLSQANIDISHLQFTHPEEKVTKLESIYHLVCMIYLDRVVEDVELEVATVYAQKLGFSPAVVADLFNSIATRDYDYDSPGSVRQEVMDFLKLHETTS
jgi:hypothetical protein